MRLDDHFYVSEMFLAAGVVLLSAMKLCGDIDWTWWAVTAPVWGYFVLVGVVARFQEYLQ